MARLACGLPTTKSSPSHGQDLLTSKIWKHTWHPNNDHENFNLNGLWTWEKNYENTRIEDNPP